MREEWGLLPADALKPGDTIRSKTTTAKVVSVDGHYIHARCEMSGEIQTYHRDYVALVKDPAKAKKAAKACRDTKSLGEPVPAEVEKHRDFFIQSWEMEKPTSAHSLWRKEYSMDQFFGFCKFLKWLNLARD